MSSEFENACKLIEKADLEALDEYFSIYPELVSMVFDNSTLLHHACAAGDIEVAKFLLDKGALVDGPSDSPSTPLHWAASLDLVDICKFLVDEGASLTATDDQGDGGTPLVQALFYGHVETSEFLASKEITPSNLRVAAGLGRIELIEEFFYFNGKLRKQAGSHRQWYRANDEFPEKPTTDSEQEILDEALCYACFNNRFDAAKYLLEKGANPNAKPFYATALHFAVAKDNLELVKHLLDSGADPLINDDNYQSTPHGWAQWGFQEEIESYLLSIMEDVDIVCAVSSGKIEKVEKLLDFMSKRDIGGEIGKQALLQAIESAEIEIEQLLRDSGAKLCLGTASAIGSVEDVSFLIGQGISPNSTMTISSAEPGTHSKPKEVSCLLLAAINKHEAVVNKLLEAGAKLDLYTAAALNMVPDLEKFLKKSKDVDKEDTVGRTALHRAIQGGALDAVKLLLEKGASVDKTSDFYSFGPRAIHVASEAGADEEIIDLLIESGSDLNDERNTGTPLDCALREGHEETAKLLLDRGAVPSEQE